MVDKKFSQEQFISALNKEVYNWESIFNSLQDPAMIVSPESLIIKANQSMLNFLGKPMDEVIGKLCHKVVHGTDTPIYLCPREMVKKTKKHQDVELYIAEKEMYVVVSVDPCLDEKGDIIQTFHVMRDFTRQRKVEKEIDEMASFRSLVIDNAAEGISVCYEIPEFPFVKFSVWNMRMEELTGYTMQEINQLGWYQSVYPDPKLQEAAKERMAKMRQGDNLKLEEWEITHKDGSKRTLAISTSVLKASDEIVHVLAIMSDVTERKIAEKSLRESESRIKSIFHIAPIAIGVVDPSNRELREVNTFLCKMLGYTQEELIGKNARILYLTDEDYEFIGKEKYRQIKEKGFGVVETRWKRKDGIAVDILLSSTPINPKDLSLGVTFTALDISERKKAESALIESEEKFRLLFESSQDAIIIVDLEKGVLDCNPATLRIFKLASKEEILGKHLGIDFSPQKQPDGIDSHIARENVIKDALQNKPYYFEWVYQCPDTSLFRAEVTINSLSYKNRSVLQVVVHDITRRKRSEEILKKKMSELEKFHNFVVDRELKMVELKKKIKALEGKKE